MITVDFLPTIPSLLSSAKTPLIHRDISWLQFNERVLDEARTATNPLLERLKFLAITSTNLDEFFMIRVPSLGRSLVKLRKNSEWGQAKKLQNVQVAVHETVAKFTSKQIETLDALASELSQQNIFLCRHLVEGTSEFAIAEKLFEEEVLPKLPPPESFALPNLSQLENMQGAIIFSGGLWVKIPRAIPGMFWRRDEISGKTFFYFLDDLLSTFLAPNFPANWNLGLVRLTRDGDFTLDFGDIDPETIPDMVMTRIGKRERGRPTRLQYRGKFSTTFLEDATKTLGLNSQQIFPATHTLYLQSLWLLVNNAPATDLEGAQALRYPPLQSKIPDIFFDSEATVFDHLKTRDCLLHHPYDSFDAFIEWLRVACDDPLVTSIELTVYRMDSLSPIIGNLKRAAKSKSVSVVIELRARFDELNNLRLADELNKAGAKVAFGFGKLKLHAKIALVTRRESDKNVYYTHLSTGNYNSATARQYTDLAVLTANKDIGQDARHFFDCLLKGEIPQTFKQLVIAPTKLARRLMSFIQAEAEAAKQGKKARIVAKVNALVDSAIIESLYHASQQGVQVDLIVRGACSLIPGIPGISDNIRVVSIVDRFLEHSRIYFFENSKQMYLSSADWMPRNFFSRLEIAFPVLDKKIYDYLREIVIPAYLSDTVKARELSHQGTWRKRGHLSHGIPVRSQVLFRELALRNYLSTPLEK